MNGAIEMGYYLTIIEQDLKCKKDIAEELKKLFESQELYYFWDYDKSTIRHGEGYFKWTEGFIKDLLILEELSARGHITCYGEEGEYYKFEATDECVKEFYGSLDQKEIDFMDNEIYRSDDGTYELSCEDFNNLKMKKGQFEKRYKAKLAPLFSAFSKEVKKRRGAFFF